MGEKKKLGIRSEELEIENLDCRADSRRETSRLYFHKIIYIV